MEAHFVHRTEKRVLPVADERAESESAVVRLVDRRVGTVVRMATRAVGKIVVQPALAASLAVEIDLAVDNRTVVSVDKRILVPLVARRSAFPNAFGSHVLRKTAAAVAPRGVESGVVSVAEVEVEVVHFGEAIGNAPAAVRHVVLAREKHAAPVAAGGEIHPG